MSNVRECKMTSRSYTKSYNRKVNNVTPGSIQFDKLFRENSNRPSAAKSAGTVGKWGITSFTSIRSTNINGRRDEIHRTFGAKKPKLDYGNQNAQLTSAKDPFMFETDLDAKVETVTPVAKPKKFFKSRNAPSASAVAATTTPSTVPDPYNARAACKPAQALPKAATIETTTITTTASSATTTTSVAAAREDAKPPIVLRICKGTARLVCGDNQTEPEVDTYRITPSPSSPEPAVDARRTRRGKNLEPVTPTPVVSSSGLSLTLRKSTTDSNNTSISHYDIVKTDCSPPTQIAAEEAVAGENPLPASTQELIDILTNDTAVTEETTQSLAPAGETAQETAAQSLVDQDWFSGSEDSDAAPTPPTSVAVESAPAAKAPAVKKGSIFKSRSTGATNGNKRRALYKHKWCDNEKESSAAESTGASTPTTASGNSAGPVTFDEEELDEAAKLTRVVTYPEAGDTDFDDTAGEAVTSIRCGKKVKGFYTVVKNVKKAHQIQESGEFQEFNDDVEYILDTLRENNPNATRCLSAIRLASKCMAPAFRMHVRAHGTVTKFFKALHDATKDQSLGLCTATVMFVLSQDRLAMDLDRNCLELMLSLLESDASHKDALDDCGLSRAELLKNKEKVRQLCADIQAQGHAKHLNLDNITVGQLAMETLLSLTSKRAGEWFKEELRELGGLEHIVNTIKDCHRQITASDVTRCGWAESVLDKLRKVDRCLRVLENVTHMNEENQVYLLRYGDGVLVSTMASLYCVCSQEIQIYPITDISDKTSTGSVIRECIFAVLKVLINLTHRFNRQSFGSKTVGSQDGIIDCSLILLLRAPDSLPEEKRFDMMMLTLILLINLVEQCDDNKKLFIQSKAPSSEGSGVEALIDLFYKQEELARGEEQKTDAILDGKKDSEQPETVTTTAKTQEEFIEETVTKLLQKAGRHMEHTLIGAYVVLLLGYLIMDNKDYEIMVRNKLPSSNFATMVAVLQKFFNFMNLTASNEASSCGIAATDKVIKFLKLSDAKVEEVLPLPALEDTSPS